MDLTRLHALKFELPPSNTTLTSLPSTLLDALIPGYGIVSQIIFRLLGFDIGLAVSGCLVIFGLAQGSRFLYSRCYGIFAAYFTSSVLIEDDDQLFRQVMEWIAEQRMTKVSRDLLAVTKWVNAYDDNDDDTTAADYEDVLDEKGIFNYEKWASNIPPRYEPNYGTDKFYFEGRCFTFQRTKREKQRSIWGNGEDQFLSISCIGRSTDPIKELLNHIKRWTLTKENKITSVFRPAPKEDRRECAWDRQSCRPSRPISTVSLDQQQKGGIVTDINEYLHPASAKWYAARGIPYRRGYLFYGPPGTGKTSLSFALAGIFGLDIYCISLMEVGLTEADLNKLFTSLPRRCIVLLEDIDSAGLRRPDDPPTSTDPPKTGARTPEVADNSGSEDGVVNVTKREALTKTPGPPTVLKSLISLSGLLNTIDGAASHEGRVLIMTTNRPESLDEALIRPGRIDMQVCFTLATHEQIRDIFKRMYSTEHDQNHAATLIEKKTRSSSTSSRPNTPSEKPKREDDEFLELLNKDPVLDIVGAEELAGMAEQFADALPEGKFSPAEIQGFLLTRKKEPRKALDEVEAWRDRELERKRKGEKVLHA